MIVPAPFVIGILFWLLVIFSDGVFRHTLFARMRMRKDWSDYSLKRIIPFHGCEKYLTKPSWISPRAVYAAAGLCAVIFAGLFFIALLLYPFGPGSAILLFIALVFPIQFFLASRVDLNDVKGIFPGCIFPLRMGWIHKINPSPGYAQMSFYFRSSPGFLRNYGVWLRKLDSLTTFLTIVIAIMLSIREAYFSYWNGGWMANGVYYDGLWAPALLLIIGVSLSFWLWIGHIELKELADEERLKEIS
jgi:hypothetical protein